MKRRALLILLVVCLMLCALPTTAFANDVCFIAINENLLELSSTPAFIGSTAYVPYWVFESFRIYYTFFTSENTAMVYTEAKQFYFEMGSGNTYDSDGRYQPAQAIFRNGQVYLPAKFICEQFGLTYSYIPSVGHGSIVRIKDSSAVLADDKFLSAASLLMDSYYNSYMGLSNNPAQGPGTTPGANEEEPDRRDTDVLMSFTGLPGDALLSALDKYAAKACFLLRVEDIAQAPDTLRRIVGSGHSVGILCGAEPAAELAEAQTLLFDAARISTLLIASDAEDDSTCRQLAQQESLAFLDYDLDAMNKGEGVRYAEVVTSQIEFSETLISVRFTCGGTTPEVLPDILRYLNQNNFSIRAPRETDAAAE